jgi:hypothetical protein
MVRLARRPEPKGIGIIVSELGAEIIGSPPRKAAADRAA